MEKKLYFSSQTENISIEVYGDSDPLMRSFLSGEVLVNGVPVPIDKNDSLMNRSWAYVSNDKYAAIAIHGFTREDHSSKDSILVISKTNGEYFFVRFKNLFKDANLLSLVVKEKEPDRIFFSVYSCSAKGGRRGYVDCQKLFAKGECLPGSRFEIPVSGEHPKLEEMFTYTVTDRYGILMQLKDGMDRNDLLRFDAFDNQYNAFKIWGDNGSVDWERSGNLLLVDSAKHESRHITWGKETSNVSRSIWDRRDRLIECMITALPFHQAFRKDRYYIVFS